MTEIFHRAVEASALVEGASLAVQINGCPVLVCLSGGAPHAVINRCTHAESPLEGGRIRKGAIICPAHGAIFKLATGECIGASPYPPLTVFKTRVEQGWIEIAVPGDSPPARLFP